MAIARLRALSHRYGGGATFALREVDLDVAPGMLLVAGSSGGGKSTLLRVLNGLVPHFHGGTISGSVTVAGLDVLRTPTRVLARHVGFVFQDPEAQLLGGTVEREVAFGLENLAVPRAQMRARVEEALAVCGIEALRGRAVATLSGGERQRVAVASTVAMGTAILALDEPTAQLDAEGAAAVVGLIRARADAGVAVVVAEHRLERLLAVADRLAGVEGGRLRGPGPVRDLAADLAAPPQVVRLGMTAAWEPLPLLPAEALRRLGGLRPLPADSGRRAWSGEVAWSFDAVAAGMDRRRACVENVTVGGGAGEVVVLMGPNGGGKTTLLRTLAGLQPPLAGTVVRRPGRVAMLPQNPTAVLHLETVRAEVELTLRRTGEPAVSASAAAILDELDLTPLADRHPRDLSTGQRQRAALAAMLCGRPAIALLDEPTRGMDAAARGALARLVGRLAADGAAVVLATHDTELAAAVADRVVEVRAGAVRDLGRPRTALTGASPYATQLGALVDGGPVTVEEALALL